MKNEHGEKDQLEKFLNDYSKGEFGFFDHFLIHKEWYSRNDLNFPVLTPALAFLSTHYAFRDLCAEWYPDHDPYRCAAALYYLKDQWHHELAELHIVRLRHFDEFTSKTKAFDAHKSKEKLLTKVLYFGLLLCMLEIRIPETLMLLVVFAISFGYLFNYFALGIPILRPFGVDAPAYIAQAG